MIASAGMGLPTRLNLTPFLLVVIICTSCNALFKEEPKPAPVSQMTGIEITADDLHKAFYDNQVAGDKRFKDRVVAVTGVVHNIQKYGDEPVVTLIANQGRGGVQCYFDLGQAEAVAKISRGQQVKIKGRLDQYYDGVVLLKECIMP